MTFCSDKEGEIDKQRWKCQQDVEYYYESILDEIASSRPKSTFMPWIN